MGIGILAILGLGIYNTSKADNMQLKPQHISSALDHLEDAIS